MFLINLCTFLKINCNCDKGNVNDMLILNTCSFQKKNILTKCVFEDGSENFVKFAEIYL